MATETETDTRLCAVEDCQWWGEPQVCLYDGRYHRHGRIHYGNEYPEMAELGITFRPLEDGGWRGICTAHYDQLKAGRKAASAMLSETKPANAQQLESLTRIAANRS